MNRRSFLSFGAGLGGIATLLGVKRAPLLEEKEWYASLGYTYCRSCSYAQSVSLRDGKVVIQEHHAPECQRYRR